MVNTDIAAPEGKVGHGNEYTFVLELPDGRTVTRGVWASTLVDAERAACEIFAEAALVSVTKHY